MDNEYKMISSQLSTVKALLEEISEGAVQMQLPQHFHKNITLLKISLNNCEAIIQDKLSLSQLEDEEENMLLLSTDSECVDDKSSIKVIYQQPHDPQAFRLLQKDSSNLLVDGSENLEDDESLQCKADNDPLIDFSDNIVQEIEDPHDEEWQVNKSQTKRKRGRKPQKCQTSEYPIQCEICSKRFETETKLINHKEKMHKIFAKLSCPLCGMILTGKQGMKNHLKVHTGVKPYSCDICNKETYTLAGMKLHKGHSHKDPKYVHLIKKRLYERVTCDICFKSITKANLDNHKFSKHKDQSKSVVCDFCGKHVQDMARLKDHLLRYHSDEKPYACDLCDNKFKDKSLLKSHKLNKHSDIRPYTCKVCRKSFKISHQLKRHVLIHNKDEHFPCPECGRTFSFRSSLKRHFQHTHKNSTATPWLMGADNTETKQEQHEEEEQVEEYTTELTVELEPNQDAHIKTDTATITSIRIIK